MEIKGRLQSLLKKFGISLFWSSERVFEKERIFLAFSQKLPLNLDFEEFLLEGKRQRIFFFFPKQIHGINLFLVDRAVLEDYQRDIEKKAWLNWMGDGSFSFEKGIFLGVRTADCVPLLFWGKVNGKKVSGALHCGWRSLAGGILFNLAKNLKIHIGDLGFSFQNFSFFAGPFIQSCCYEVKENFLQEVSFSLERVLKNFSFELEKISERRIEEIKKDFERKFQEEFVQERDGKTYFSLGNFLKWQLTLLKVPSNRIEISEKCTSCDSELFWSHRKHGEKRKYQISFIGLLDSG